MEASDKIPEDQSAPTPLEYAAPAGRNPIFTRAYIFVAAFLGTLMLLGVAMLFSAILVPALNGPRPAANRVRCASNLRQIGQAIQMYANEHNHQLPPNLSAVLENEDLTPEVFVCPETSDIPATGPTTQGVLADFAKPGHCSYLYFGTGLLDTGDPKTVIAAEPLTNHAGSGANVLFLDGHVEFLPAPVVKNLIGKATTQPTVLR
jgi:prepilin-type processing-associated H-X9-DG protein